jgi:hypothetical protein
MNARYRACVYASDFSSPVELSRVQNSPCKPQYATRPRPRVARYKVRSVVGTSFEFIYRLVTRLRCAIGFGLGIGMALR